MRRARRPAAESSVEYGTSILDLAAGECAVFSLLPLGCVHERGDLRRRARFRSRMSAGRDFFLQEKFIEPAKFVTGRRVGRFTVVAMGARRVLIGEME